MIIGWSISLKTSRLLRLSLSVAFFANAFSNAGLQVVWSDVIPIFSRLYGWLFKYLRQPFSGIVSPIVVGLFSSAHQNFQYMPCGISPRRRRTGLISLHILVGKIEVILPEKNADTVDKNAVAAAASK